MVEIGTQCIISDRTWEKMPGVRALAETALRRELERVGCRGIVVEEPRHEWFAPDPDSEYQWEPYWGWEINAVGEREEALLT